MKKLLVILLILASCTSESDFQKGKYLLESQGFTDVKATGYANFCCSKEDSFSTGFSCKGKNGAIVTGCFCSSPSKGLTIRYN